MNKKSNPLKAKPLRQAGQSVQEKLDELIDDKIMGYGVLIIFLFTLTVLE